MPRRIPILRRHTNNVIEVAMAYHPLSNDTGGSADDRRSEADRILVMLKDAFECGELTERESDFVEDMMQNASDISPKQLFWLRDIKDKYL